MLAGIRRPRWWHDLNGTGLVPVPANSGASGAVAARPSSASNSNPGIRRPRWGGVVEGVAGQIRHPLAYDCEAVATRMGRVGRQLPAEN